MPQIPLWAYILVPLIALSGGVWAGWVALKNAKATGTQVTLSDIINQMQENQKEDRLVIQQQSNRITGLEVAVHKSEEFERMARKFMWQQDMWIIRVYDPSVHPEPPVMPDALKPSD